MLAEMALSRSRSSSSKRWCCLPEKELQTIVFSLQRRLRNLRGLEIQGVVHGKRRPVGDQGKKHPSLQ